MLSSVVFPAVVFTSGFLTRISDKRILRPKWDICVIQSKAQQRGGKNAEAEEGEPF